MAYSFPALVHAWRVVVPAAALLLLLGFALLPGIHPTLRLPVLLVVAALVGLGAELVAAQPSRGGEPAEPVGTFWIIPAGAVVAAAVWLSVVGRSSWGLILAAVLIVAATLCAQSVEVQGPPSLRGAAHAINIGVGFALGLPAYVFSASTAMPVRLVLSTAVTALLVLVVLRRPGLPVGAAAGFTALAALVVAELGFLLAQMPLSPALCGGLMLVALYAASAVAHALVERAGPRAYVEIGVVSLGALGVSVLVIPRL